MELSDKEKAKAFLNPVEIGKVADAAGASDFQWYFSEKSYDYKQPCEGLKPSQR